MTLTVAKALLYAVVSYTPDDTITGNAGGTLSDLTSAATGTHAPPVTGTGLIELEALTSTGSGPGAAAQLRHQITGLMGTDRRTVALTGTQRQTKTLSATWAAQT
jgi:hypothetical protein